MGAVIGSLGGGRNYKRRAASSFCKISCGAVLREGSALPGSRGGCGMVLRIWSIMENVGPFWCSMLQDFTSSY